MRFLAQILYGLLFNELYPSERVEPKLIYRSDTSNSLYMMYPTLPTAKEIKIGIVQQRDGIITEEYHAIPQATSAKKNVHAFFDFVEAHINGRPYKPEYMRKYPETAAQKRLADSNADDWKIPPAHAIEEMQGDEVWGD